MNDTTKTFALVEKTEGPHNGKVWRTATMTQSEVDTINAGVHVVQWEPCGPNTQYDPISLARAIYADTL